MENAIGIRILVFEAWGSEELMETVNKWLKKREKEIEIVFACQSEIRGRLGVRISLTLFLRKKPA